jgi:hypothetical protein
LNSKYDEIRGNVLERLEEFFKGFNEIVEVYRQVTESSMIDETRSVDDIKLYPVNRIFKKILLGKLLYNRIENNRISQGDVLIDKVEDVDGRSRILICSDTEVDKFDYDQKLLFLIRRQVNI